MNIIGLDVGFSQDRPTSGVAHLDGTSLRDASRSRRREAPARASCAKAPDARPHRSVLRKTWGLNFGLPALYAWACSRCGRKAYNLKVFQYHDEGAAVSRAAVR